MTFNILCTEICILVSKLYKLDEIIIQCTTVEFTHTDEITVSESISTSFYMPLKLESRLSIIGGLDYWNGHLEWTLTFLFSFSFC